MHGEETLVPISICLGGFAMAFGIVYLKTRQNMAMIEKGMKAEAISIYKEARPNYHSVAYNTIDKIVVEK